VHVKCVVAFAPHGWAIVAGGFAVRAASFEGRAANSTAIIGSIPFPGCHSVPARNLNLDHGVDLFILRALDAKGIRVSLGSRSDQLSNRSAERRNRGPSDRRLEEVCFEIRKKIVVVHDGLQGVFYRG